MCIQVFLHIHAYKRIGVALLGSIEGWGAAAGVAGRRFFTLHLTLIIKLMYAYRGPAAGAAGPGGLAGRVVSLGCGSGTTTAATTCTARRGPHRRHPAAHGTGPAP